ncbi:branched-chain amino acid ABC transporter permease [Rhizocola hellebori]|uniref:Branched-chain amino acid ABC transporter permease n=1 Tax=Rhizocola hellebori TaxID=1392758 RepID=A0A8J3Q3X0_9ACTN|nr:branched-chain amino acid ABC transporter permease [Rhizocola hellebori]GIH03017.1 branched-chain amino acid ABC transporter permease [Rhizocola hellebori]
MTEAIQILSRGLGAGGIYALLSLGFVIIYRASRVISFAQPALMLAGAVIVSRLAPEVGFYGALAAGMALTATLALAVERVAVRPMVGRPVFTVAIITLGVDAVIRVFANSVIGVGLLQLGDPWGLSETTVFGVEVQQRSLVIVAATALAGTILYVFFRFSRMGLAMRAVAVDQETALAHGISVGAVFAFSWAIAGALAALGGAMAAVGGSVDANLWLTALVALPVIILGGLDSLPGAVVAGLVVGVVQETLATYQHTFPNWLGGNVATLTPFAVMMIVLLVRPYGLFGTREVERV